MIKKYPKQFKKVSDYLESKFGVNVLLGQITAFMGHKNKKIFIHHNHNLEKNGLYALLHEVGHLLQNDEDNYFKTIDEDKEPKKFTGGDFSFSDYDVTIPCVNNSMVIFPSSFKHEVSPVEMTSDDIQHTW